ncbi:MAG TPA: CusA/CzcA family heavy metal efflux RND transporter [Verrucomicrobiae bacterium]|nr:CusA/CzcA family heavy metal efflux RND transporter [Verrucomicrobiae bacterium]
MLTRVIDFSLKNKFIVVLATAALVLGGIYSIRHIPLDAIPDLSDTQVIIYTPWEGQAPNIVEDQVTYPITTKMLSVPHAKVVRGYSFYGYSFVYVIFDDGTDPYWARSRVLEYLSSISGQLPKNVTPTLGPDATGVGWAFMYSINSTNRNLADLRSIQDWYLKYQLTAVPGVSEVASIGGFVKQYQVTVDPTKLRAYNISLNDVSRAIERSNGEVGGRSLELSEREFILRVKGYIENLDDLKRVAVGVGENGVPILLRDVANIQFGPDMRRGIADLNGDGETVGGIVVVRYGANAYKVIQDVKARLDQAMKAVPPDVKVTVTYDRTALIDRAVKTLEEKLLEESIVVALVCLAFLLHLRSALVAIIILPVAVLISFLVMFGQGISSNIMSLGGIAIAIGAMVDAVIIMIENAHKHLEHDTGKKPHWQIIRDASVEVGPALFYSLLVITVSFLPVFTLQEQEGRLFKPLAFTKTYSMAAAALLSITLAPVLMGWFIRGKIPKEERNPINHFLIWLYKPVVDFAIRYRWLVVVCGGILVGWVFLPWNAIVARVLPDGRVKQFAFTVGKVFPYQNIGSEFMPPLYEGDLLYMPTTFPGVSPTKARELIQVTDRIIKSFPEVETVFGKAGRAETATDPAPLDMIETTIRLKPESEWPAVDIKDDDDRLIAHRRRTPDELVAAMNAAVQIPGLNNAWTMPIRTRIDMLSTGIKTPVGIKIAGPDLDELERIGIEVEAVVRKVPGTASAFAERVTGGRYIEFNINRDAIARYGLTVGDVQDVLSVALGGKPLTTTVEGLQRYTINLRYDRDFRSDLDSLKRDIVIPTPTGAQIPLGELADIKVVDGPMSIKTEGAVPNDWVYVDIHDVDVGTYVQNAMHAVNAAIARGQIKLPPGYNIFWSGQYEYMLRAKQRLLLVVPLTLLIISLIIYLNTRSLLKTAIVLLAVPFSLVGTFWTLYLLHYNLSVAVWIGIIALAGLDAETGVIMLLYLELAFGEWKQKGLMRNVTDLRDAIYHGAVKRLRPKIMTACVIIAGLAPILWSHGSGADVMKRIAAPMMGGVVTSTLMELAVYPAIFYLWRSRRIKMSD